MNVAAVKRMTMPERRRQNRLEWVAYVDSQEAVTRCARCSWKFRGDVGTGKKLFQLHVRHEHGGAA